MSDYATFRDAPRRNISAELVQAIALHPAGLTVAEVMKLVNPDMAPKRVSALLHKMTERGVLAKSLIRRPTSQQTVSLFVVASKDRRHKAMLPVPSLIRAYLERHGTGTLEEIAHGVRAPVRTVRPVLARMIDGEEVHRVGPPNRLRYELAPLDDLPVIPFVSAIRARALGWASPVRRAA